jgi:ketosteroid isomerase-like protein
MSDLVGIVSDSLERWNTGERDADSFPLHPDFELVSPMSILNGEPFLGKEGFAAWLKEIDDVWTERRVEAREFRTVANRVLVIGVFRLRGAGSEALFEQAMFWVFGFEGERIARMRLFLDEAEALELFESGG